MLEYFPEKSIRFPFDDCKVTQSMVFEALKLNPSPESIRCWFSHAIPTKESVDELSKYVKDCDVLEVGAGRALWAMLLSTYTKSYKCTDAFPPKWSYVDAVDCIDVNNIDYSGVDILVIIWPPVSNMASTALKKFIKTNTHKKIVYIGEWIGGCTADDYFFELFETNFKVESVITIPTIFGHTDKIYVGNKK